MIRLGTNNEALIIITEQSEWKNRIVNSLLDLMKANISTGYIEEVHRNLLELIKLVNNSTITENDIVIEIPNNDKGVNKTKEDYLDSLFYLLGAIMPSKANLESDSCPLYCVSILLQALTNSLNPLKKAV